MTLTRIAVDHASATHAADMAADRDLKVALAAAQRLAGAATVELLCYDHDTGHLVSIAGDVSIPRVAFCREMLTAIQKAHTIRLSDTAPSCIRKARGDSVLVKVADRPASSLFLVLHLAGSAPAERDHVLRVIPDLAVLIGLHVGLDRQLDDMVERQDAHVDALDHGECGVIAVRADHSVVFANAAASAHLANEDGLRLRRGALRPVDNASAIRFEAAFNSVISGHRAPAASRARANVMLLPGKALGAAPVIVVIAPASPASLRTEKGRGAAAIVYLLPAAQGNGRGLETLCRLHGLTRVESRLIDHLMAGRTLTEAAAAMRIKSETVRAYLKQIFAKTGIHRQTDLIAMMTRYQRAVRGDFDFQPA